MVSQFSGKNMMKKCLKIVSSPRVRLILALFYAVLSLSGPILLLKNRKDLVKEYNVKRVFTDETMSAIVFIFGQFWMITNVFLLCAVISGKVVYKKIHLYFMAGLFIGIVAVLIFIGLGILYYGVQKFDKSQTPWFEMTYKALKYIGAFSMLVIIVSLILLLCIASIYYVLIGGIKSNKSFEKPTPFGEELKDVATVKNAAEMENADEQEIGKMLNEHDQMVAADHIA